jgi:hypothetical protein
MKINYVGYGKKLFAINAGGCGFLIGIALLNTPHDLFTQAFLSITFGLNFFPVLVSILNDSASNHKQETEADKQ